MQHQLISTIRHSLNAAQSALSLLEEINGSVPSSPPVSVEDQSNALVSMAVVQDLVEVVSNETPKVVETSIPSLFNQVLSELNHPRYSLRTLSELSNKLGVTQTEIFKVLEDEGVAYVTKNRRSDGAKLIGLTDRN